MTKEEEATSEAQVFSPPGDPALMKDIEDIQERIQPLPTTRDQVTALAKYVLTDNVFHFVSVMFCVGIDFHLWRRLINV